MKGTHANMKEKSKVLVTKKIKITLLIITGLLLIILFSGYLFIRGYIKRMNLVPVAEGVLLEENLNMVNELDSEPEDGLDVPEASEEEINTVEDGIRKNMEANSTMVKYDKNVLNVLLIGCDTRKAGGSGRSDAMILVSINKKSKKIVATSILRDIYLQIPGKTINNRINTAYAYGGADLLMKTVEQNFKVKIDRYVAIDFFAFMDVIDAINGVTIKVTEKEVPHINDYVNSINRLTGEDEKKDYLTEPGTLVLNGKQALGYVRVRYIGTDFERTHRQRKVLEQIFQKIQNQKLLEMDKTLKTILPQITTNLSEGEIFSHILALPSYSGYEIEQSRIPIDGSYSFMKIRKMSVIGIDFKKNIEHLHKTIYGELD